MGTDIHGIWQTYKDGAWKDIPSLYKENRDYNLFAVLADVRNGYGFAGVPTGNQVEPIAFPRGFPNDFELMEDPKYCHPIDTFDNISPALVWLVSVYVDADGNDKIYYRWMGDHSYSWLSGEEMLEWYNTPHEKVHYGVLDREVYENWNKSGHPSEWCGDVEGDGVIKVVDDEEDMLETPNWTHAYCTWKTSLNEDLSYFFDEVQRLVNEYGKIRFVFGFDS